jgi:hypothetical protein
MRIPKKRGVINLPNTTISHNGTYKCNDGAVEDCLDGYTEDNLPMVLIALDATLWDARDRQRWKERIKRMMKYTMILNKKKKGLRPLYTCSVIVMPQGWDSSQKHAIQDGIHIISFNYMEEFLELIDNATNYYDTKNALDKILYTKQEKCPKCKRNTLIYGSIISCNKYGQLTEDVIDLFTEIGGYEEKGAKQICLCRGCEEKDAFCEFNVNYDIFCKHCGWIKENQEILHICSLGQFHGSFEECYDCTEPNECEYTTKIKNLCRIEFPLEIKEENN